MKPHPRIRKVVKWGGAAVTVLVVAVWVWTVFGQWFAAYRAHNGSAFAIMAGRLIVAWRDLGIRHDPDYPYGLEIDACSAHAWNFGWLHGRSGWELGIPLWFVAGVPLLASAIAWRLDALAHRRGRRHLCAECHYDRTGLVIDAKCPECGTTPAIAQAKAKTATDDTNAHG